MTSPAEASTDTVTIPTAKELQLHRMMLNARLVAEQAPEPYFEGRSKGTSHLVLGREELAMPSAETIASRLLRVSHG